MCFRKSEFAADNPTFASDVLLEAFVANREEVPLVKWQYFGTEEGVLFSFPAQKTMMCKGYDPRFRSALYVYIVIIYVCSASYLHQHIFHTRNFSHKITIIYGQYKLQNNRFQPNFMKLLMS